METKLIVLWLISEHESQSLRVESAPIKSDLILQIEYYIHIYMMIQNSKLYRRQYHLHIYILLIQCIDKYSISDKQLVPAVF